MVISDWGADVCSSDREVVRNFVSGLILLDERLVGKVSVAPQRGIEAPGTLNFPAVTARYFRITPSAKTALAEALFYATPRIDNWDLKAEYGFDMAAGPARSAADTDDGGAIDRKSGVSGKSVAVRVDLGGRRIIKKK